MQFDYEYAHQIMLAIAASPYPDPINDPDFLPQFVRTSRSRRNRRVKSDSRPC